MERDRFLLRYPWPWFVLPPPSPDILSQIRRPETVADEALAETTEVEDKDPGRKGASLDALCLEVRPLDHIAVAHAVVSVGRSGEGDVVLLDESVSRRHAELAFDRRTGQGHITCLGARNGSWVDGVRLDSRVAVPLASGAVVRLGGLTMRYYDPPGFLDWLVQGAPRSGAAPARWPGREDDED